MMNDKNPTTGQQVAFADIKNSDTCNISAHAYEQLDFIFKAWIARFTAAISPAAIIFAYTDWFIHFTASPAKHIELWQKALAKFWRWSLYASDPMHARSYDTDVKLERCIEPLPQDKRFATDEWEQWPFNVIAQGFLLQQQWWHSVTTGISGVSPHHENMVTFINRQILDMLAPSNFVLTNPVVLEKTISENGMNLIHSMYHAFFDRLRLITHQPTYMGSTFKVGATLAITPGKVVFRNRLIELIQYSPVTKHVYATPVLFVPAWIMKYYILDLSQDNSMVKYLVEQGHTVFMISWKNPKAEDRNLSMEDYRTLGVMAALDNITQMTQSPKINAVGYCLGGTLLSITAATMARDHDERLASITLFAAQTDFEEPGELSLFIDDSQISFLETAMWEKGYLDSAQMAGAFQLLRSNDLIWSHRLNQYLLGKPEQQSDLMAWNTDATRMPYRMHSEYLRTLFLHNDLAAGRYLADGSVISLTDIRVPIFAVGTQTDHVAPWHSVFKIHHLTRTSITFLLTSGGHNAGIISPPGHPHRSYQIAEHTFKDIFIDAESWRASVTAYEGSWWPAWEAWLARHAGPQTSMPPSMGQALCDAPGTYVCQ